MNSEEIKPIFIVGMNGSGTTMLFDCLNHHPLIYIHKVESRVIPYYYNNIHKYGDLKDKKRFKNLLHDFANNYAFRACNNSLELDIPIKFNELQEHNLAKIIELTFSYFASRESKIIWGDHSPKYAAFIPLLIDLFPKAKIIHIIRDGRDCAQSFKRRFGQNLYRAIFQWKNLVGKARKDGNYIGKERYFEIKYEDLTRDPENHMKRICQFLEVPFDTRVLMSNMPMFVDIDSNIQANQKKSIVPNTGKWKKTLTKRQIKKLEDIAGLTLKEVGYEVVCTEGSKDIGRIRLFILSVFDKINASIAFYKEYDEKDKFGTFIRSVLTSIKQRKSF